jgi:hypothetical protein
MKPRPKSKKKKTILPTAWRRAAIDLSCSNARLANTIRDTDETLTRLTELLSDVDRTLHRGRKKDR